MQASKEKISGFLHRQATPLIILLSTYNIWYLIFRTEWSRIWALGSQHQWLFIYCVTGLVFIATISVIGVFVALLRRRKSLAISMLQGLVISLLFSSAVFSKASRFETIPWMMMSLLILCSMQCWFFSCLAPKYLEPCGRIING